jgi:hypothetical protein
MQTGNMQSVPASPTLAFECFIEADTMPITFSIYKYTLQSIGLAENIRTTSLSLFPELTLCQNSHHSQTAEHPADEKPSLGQRVYELVSCQKPWVHSPLSEAVFYPALLVPEMLRTNAGCS